MAGHYRPKPQDIPEFHYTPIDLRNILNYPPSRAIIIKQPYHPIKHATITIKDVRCHRTQCNQLTSNTKSTSPVMLSCCDDRNFASK